MSDEQVDASELLDAIQQYKDQLAAIADVITEDPTNTEAQQIHAELQEALTATETAYVEFSQDRNAADTTNSHGAAPAEPAAAVQTQPAARRAVGRTMHPENIYASQEPDFAALAAQYPPLAPFVMVTKAGRPSIDFTNWHATKELTAALLKVDFGVVWDLPEGQLVPPVPNRANYVHWISDLLQLSSPAGDEVRGLDIGCGANLIYCLLGAAIYRWHMTGVDVTEVALQGANTNRHANHQLARLLEVRQSKCMIQQLPQQQQQQQQVLGPLLGAMANSQERFHFCMCNPPFFESIHDANQNPNTACGGTSEELVCPGGELAFIRAMIADSKELQGSVHWYSSMCGKKSSLKVLRQELHAAGVTALRTTELIQGRTSRWAIAWSFAASPNTANMPLPRRQQQYRQQQQRQQPTTSMATTRDTGGGSLRGCAAQKVTFTVTASPADGRKLLQSLAALLTADGHAQQVHTDLTAWNITCKLPAVAAGDSTEQQQQQQQQQQEEEEKCGVGEPPEKRARTAADVSGSSSGGSSGDSVEVAVFQQRRGTFDVVARLQSGSSGNRSLLDVVAAVREDIALMWPVSDLRCL